MRILFIGCVESSYRLLKALLEAGADIVGVITKQSSNYNADFKDLTPLCEEYKVNYIYVSNVNDSDSIAFLEQSKADIAFCFGWSQLIKNEFLEKISKGVVGFHPAALPQNRGRHPIIWALALGLQETASTFFMLDKDADTGDIVSQVSVYISYTDDAGSLYEKIMDKAEQQIIALWKDFENNTVTRVKQEKEGNNWRKRGKKDGEIDWRMSKQSIYNLVRSLSKPYVGAHFIYNSQEIKVWRVKEIQEKNYKNIEPGKVLAINVDGSIDVKVSDGIIRILESESVDLKVGDYL